MIKFILGCVTTWLFAALITVCLHYSLFPHMSITWRSITSMWGLSVIWLVFWCAIDLKITQKTSGPKFDPEELIKRLRIKKDM